MKLSSVKSENDYEKIMRVSKRFYYTERRMLYDTAYFDGHSIDFFTKTLGQPSYSPVRQDYRKTLSDTCLDYDVLPPFCHFIVEEILVEEKIGDKFTPINTRGYFAFFVGSVKLIGFPTDIISEEIPAIYISPQRNFFASLSGELLDRDLSIEPAYRCRLRGISVRAYQ